jgi:hypothetical protein
MLSSLRMLFRVTKTIAFTCLFSIGLSSQLHANPCDKILSNETEGLPSYLKHVLKGTDNSENIYLDKLMREHIHNQLLQVEPSRRRRIEKVLKNTKLVSMKSGPGSGFVQTRLGRLPEMQLDEELAHHPFIRILVVHEFRHLLQLIRSGNILVRLKKVAHTALLLPHRILKVETEAFADEYDFIRKAYSLEDLPRLQQEFPIAQNFANPDFSNHEDFLNAIGVLTKSAVNADFLHVVGNALSLTKDKYVAMNLEGYYQEQDAQDEAARKLAIRLFGVTIPIAGAGVLQYFFHIFQ